MPTRGAIDQSPEGDSSGGNARELVRTGSRQDAPGRVRRRKDAVSQRSQWTRFLILGYRVSGGDVRLSLGLGSPIDALAILSVESARRNEIILAISRNCRKFSSDLTYHPATMAPLRIGYGQSEILQSELNSPTYLVREHFSSPLLQYAEEDAGKTFTLVECPST